MESYLGLGSRWRKLWDGILCGYLLLHRCELVMILPGGKRKEKATHDNLAVF